MTSPRVLVKLLDGCTICFMRFASGRYQYEKEREITMTIEDAYLSENDGDRDEDVNTLEELIRLGRYVSFALKSTARGVPPDFAEARILDFNDRFILLRVDDRDYNRVFEVAYPYDAFFAIRPSTGPRTQR